MKKFLLLLALFASSIGAMAQDAVSAKVSGSTLNIGLTNSVEYVAFQMDIKLPAGVNATTFSAVTSRLTAGSTAAIGDPGFIVASNKIDDANNIYRVIAYNLSNNAIAGASGDDVLTIALSATVGTPSQVEVSNILFVKKDGLAAQKLANVTGVAGYKLGDVNHDNRVNVDDITSMVNYICLKNPSPFYTSEANTAPSNPTINVDDLTALINIIKSGL